MESRRTRSFGLLGAKGRTNIAASIDVYRSRFRELMDAPEIRDTKRKASEIRDRDLKRADLLWRRAREQLERNGIAVHFAPSNAEAVGVLGGLLAGKRLVVVSKSNLLHELQVRRHLNSTLVETDIGDWVVSHMGVARAHPNAPALALSPREIARFIRSRFGARIRPRPDSLVEWVRKRIRSRILRADAGLTGASFVTAEGHLVIVENEGNISLTSKIPQTHIAVAAYHRITETLGDAMYLSGCLSRFGTARRSPAYINVISSPSYTTDIQKTIVRGVQGPKDVHLLVVDNGRRSALENDRLRKALRCIGCGACMLHCPVTAVAGSAFGGAYLGGIGLVFGHFVCKEKIDERNGVFACLGCEMCEEVCPVEAKIWDNMKCMRGSMVSERKRQVLVGTKATGLFSYPG